MLTKLSEPAKVCGLGHVIEAYTYLLKTVFVMIDRLSHLKDGPRLCIWYRTHIVHGTGFTSSS